MSARNGVSRGASEAFPNGVWERGERNGTAARRSTATAEARASNFVAEGGGGVGVGDGEEEFKFGALADFGFDLHFALVVFHDFFDDGEADAGAGFLVGEEGGEEVGDLVGGHALAVVADGKDEVGFTFKFLDGGAEAQDASPGHGFGGVEDEVEEDLLDLFPGGAEGGGIVGGGAADVDVLLEKFVAGEEEDVVEELLGVDGFLDGLGGAGEGEDLVENAVHLPHFFADELGVALGGGIELQGLDQGVEEHLHDGEGVADFVRDFGGEKAESGEAFAGAEFFLHVDDAGKEAALFDGYGGEVAEGGEDFDFVVGEAVALLGVNGEDANGFAREGEGDGEHGDEAFLARDVGLDVALFADDIDDGDGFVAGGGGRGGGGRGAGGGVAR